MEPRAAPSLRKPQRGEGWRGVRRGGPLHVPYEVLGGLLGVPLLALFAGLHLGQQRLPVRLVGLDDVLQLLHEEQLQHALVRVQVSQLEQLPLQDVVIPEGGGGAGGGISNCITTNSKLPLWVSHSLERSAGVNLQPVRDLGRVVRVGGHQHRLVPLRRPRLVGDGRWQRGRLVVARDAEARPGRGGHGVELK